MPSTSFRALLLLVVFSGCGSTWKVADLDGDGLTPAEGDCWESDSSPAGTTLSADEIFPGAEEEWYDGFDQDCGGDDDYDADADGVAASGYGEGTDCDDTDSGTYPGAEDTWYDGVDSDCGGADEDYDADGDGSDADGYGEGGDCDDTDSAVGPGAAEIWYDGDDQDCAGDDDFDADGDGSVVTNDCDDNDASAYPGGTEVWYDGVDGDCLGDDDFDQDGDGYGLEGSGEGTSDDCDDENSDINVAATETWYDGVDQDCDDWSDYDADLDSFDADTSGGDDCDDTRAETNPDTSEVCNLRDDNCNGETDEGYEATDTITFYADADGDTYGDVSTVEYACEGYEPDGYVLNNDDCDDTDGEDYPGATETTGNGDDEDCDGAEVCFDDDDDDGFIDTTDDTRASTDTDCDDTKEGTDTDLTTDCDDKSSDDYPGATETIGNGDDEDCDNAETCYDDDDNDGYLDTTADTRASTDTDCSDAYEGTSTDATTDCDDADASDYPGATETVGNGDDEDCDGAETCYEDDDNDGYLDTTADTLASTDTDCSDTYEGLSTDPTTDCDDASASDYPGATETTGNGDDEDCDGAEVCFDDDDNDGYLDTTADTRASTDTDCNDSYEGKTTDATTDCDDADASDYPGATETTGNGDDEDCDGAEICYDDDDNDGYLDTTADTRTSTDTDCSDTYEGLSTDPTTDCDDASASDYPGATETTGNGDDDDCNGAEVCFDDDDNDGYLDTTADTRTSTDTDCSDANEGLSTDATTDCDDTDATIYVGATEVCEDDEVNDCSATASDAFADCALYGTDDLGTVTDILLGATTGDELGASVAAAGDVDGDGKANFLVMGATSTDDGVVYLMDGTISASGGTNVSTIDVGAITAEAAGDLLGLAMSAGDVDGDGYDDLVLAAESNDGASLNAGAVYVVLAPVTAGGTVLSLYDAKFSGAATGDRGGAGVAVLGDTDGDDNADILIGADGYDNGSTSACGGAYFISGPGSTGSLTLVGAADAVFTGDAKNDYFGETVAAAGDIDGDGTPDALVGAPGAATGTVADAGRAYLFFGPFTGTTAAASADLILQGTAKDDVMSTSLAGGGDLDGDGYDDILLGAPENDDGGSNAGAAYVVLGTLSASASVLSMSASDASLTGTDADDGAGISVAIAPDVDGDGIDEVLIGAPGNDDGGSGAGAAYLIYGPPTSISLSSADVIFTGDTAADSAGSSVSGAGDTNGDGYGDLLIGAPYGDPTSKTDGGEVYLPLGSSY